MANTRRPLLDLGSASTRTGRALGTSAHPPGLHGLYFTELWERFSYYGMRAILVLFLVAPLSEGGMGFANAEATRIYGTYTMATYMLAIPGGFIADRLLGARRSVMIGGFTIALGHFSMAVPSIPFFYAGLLLIALGTGLFKPNISSLVGALYARDDARRDAGFALFYMGINVGALLSPLLVGYLAQSAAFKRVLAAAGLDPALSWHWGFGAAGVGMSIAMMFFMRNSATLPDSDPIPVPGTASFFRQGLTVIAGTALLFGIAVLSDMEGLTWLRGIFIILPLAGIAFGLSRGTEDGRRLAAIGVFFIAAMIFWTIFDQAGTTLSLFADQLTQNKVMNFDFPSSWYQSVNPVFVILLTPFFAALWMKLGRRQPSVSIKFAFGLVFLAASFLLMVPAANAAAEGRVSPLWLVGLYFLSTVGELFLSPVGLSAMTRLAPANMTGMVLGLWFLATAFGDKLAGIIGGAFSASDPDAVALSFLSQAGIVAVAAVLMFALAPGVTRLSGGER